ncbi:hypothetical protein V8E54_004012 [Elaphomyces granulatus]
MPFLPTRTDIQISYEQWLNSEGFTRDRDDEITNNPLETEPFVIDQEFDTDMYSDSELDGSDEDDNEPGSEDEPEPELELELEPGSDEDELGLDEDEPGSDEDEPGSEHEPGPDEPDSDEPDLEEADSEDETDSLASEILRDGLALYYMAHSVIESIQYEESDVEYD